MSLQPLTRFAPSEIAPETFLIHQHHGEGQAPVSVALNAMVIRAAEPVVVDTGVAEGREQYFEDLFSIVEPEDVRWVSVRPDHRRVLGVGLVRHPDAHACEVPAQPDQSVLEQIQQAMTAMTAMTAMAA